MDTEFNMMCCIKSLQRFRPDMKINNFIREISSFVNLRIISPAMTGSSTRMVIYTDSEHVFTQSDNFHIIPYNISSKQRCIFTKISLEFSISVCHNILRGGLLDGLDVFIPHIRHLSDMVDIYEILGISAEICEESIYISTEDYERTVNSSQDTVVFITNIIDSLADYEKLRDRVEYMYTYYLMQTLCKYDKL
jgi:hypothetical protein